MTVTAVAGHRVDVALRPRREGANIRTWVGFKHFLYLVEEAVLAWFRARGHGPSRLYHEHGLALSIVDTSAQLPSVLDLDDVVDATVTGGPERFAVRLRVGDRTVLRGTVVVALVPVAEPVSPVPVGLAGAVRALGPGAPGEPLAGDAWSWRVPYYYCQFSEHLQHSGYVRLLEEAVDRFLAARGLSVRTGLVERGWIPVVSRVRVTVLGDVPMEATVDTRFTVTDVLKNLGFEARMDCYGVTRHVATATILHGFAVARGPDAGRLAELDAATVATLWRRPA